MKAVAEGALVLGVVVQILGGQRRRPAEAYDAQYVLGARPQTPFVVRAMHELGQCGVAPYIERSHPLGRVELVARYAEQVHAEIVHRSGNLAHGLGRV